MRHVNLRHVKKLIPKRRGPSHKGEHGVLVIIGGSSRYSGAPALAGLSALRSGVDLAIVCSPEETAKIIRGYSPDLIVISLPCTDLDKNSVNLIVQELQKATAVAIGPGLGTSPHTKEAVRELLIKMPEIPAVIDADALKILAESKDLLRKNFVLTPHAGEFKILTGEELGEDVKERAEAVERFSKEMGCTVVLKGHVDIIAGDGKVYANKTGNPGMTVGGTGDVLTGVIGSFLAQGLRPLDASLVGTFVVGRAGDLCLAEKGYWFTATDVVGKIPYILKKIWQGSR